MKVIFAGTPGSVLPVPKQLVEAGHELLAVVTGPDKPVGREQNLTPTAVASWAKSNRIRVLAPEKLDDEFYSAFAGLGKGADVIVVAAYGKIVPKRFLELGKMGWLNVHPSLLPAFRGASPVAGAIVAGETETGLTIIKMDEEMDHGPIVFQKKREINDSITGGELTKELFKEGAEALISVLSDMASGRVTWREQDHSKASFTKRLVRADGRVELEWLAAAIGGEEIKARVTPPPLVGQVFQVTPKLIYNLVRGLGPWPGVWTEVAVKGVTVQLKILEAGLEDGKLKLKRVQLAGKKPVSFEQFNQAYPRVCSKS